MAKMNAAARTAGTLLLILAVLAPVSCGTTGFDGTTSERLQQALESVVMEWGIPGAAAGVWQDAKYWSGSCGSADLEAGVAPGPRMHFRIGSITKSFVSTVILQMADEGLLGLDDPAGRYLAGLPAGNEITVRSLLNMTSGVYNYTDDPEFFSSLERDLFRKWEPGELLEVAFSHPLQFPPGTTWSYSNTNYILLGMIIEKVSGKRLEDEISTRIIGRLGLNDTSFGEGPDIGAPFIHGYRTDPDTGRVVDVTLQDPSHAWAAGAMISTIEDLGTWSAALAKGSLLSPEAHREQFDMIDTGIPFVRYGLGVFEVNRMTGGGGAIFGYDCAAFNVPENDITIVAMVNMQPVEGAGNVAMRMLVPALAAALR